MGRGMRQVLSEMLVPFKAVVQLGGVKGVMMLVVSVLMHPFVLDDLSSGHIVNLMACLVMLTHCFMTHWMSGVTMVRIRADQSLG